VESPLFDDRTGVDAMFTDPSQQRQLAHLYALGQVGLEMVVPIGLGLLIDWYFQVSPWGVVIGAVLGFVGGFAHLINLLKRLEENSSGSRRDAP
jgi:F0F1-type ATP synthase assembly protein I